MATIGLTITEQIATEKGLLANTMVRVRSVEGQGKSETHKKMGIIYDVYENRARFEAGDFTLQVLKFSQRKDIEIPLADEISETTVHQALKTVLEAEGFTVTEETTI